MSRMLACPYVHAMPYLAAVRLLNTPFRLYMLRGLTQRPGHLAARGDSQRLQGRPALSVARHGYAAPVMLWLEGDDHTLTHCNLTRHFRVLFSVRDGLPPGRRLQPSQVHGPAPTVRWQAKPHEPHCLTDGSD